MPELPEVETVKRTLERYLLERKIIDIHVYYSKILANVSVENFKKSLLNQKIVGMSRRGKWLIFELENYDLVSHLRMEGKYFLKSPEETVTKHEHVVFTLDNGKELRYQDTRKFGRMYLFKKGTLYQELPLSEIGKEPWDDKLTEEYLKEKLKDKRIPIKTALLDQTIIAGIGNIYADEILFLSGIHPLKSSCKLTKKNRIDIIESTRKILGDAIEMGGTTIRSYESEKGVHGRFQQNLLIHTLTNCSTCKSAVEKIVVGGRGTYFCRNCQKRR